MIGVDLDVTYKNRWHIPFPSITAIPRREEKMRRKKDRKTKAYKESE